MCVCVRFSDCVEACASSAFPDECVTLLLGGLGEPVSVVLSLLVEAKVSAAARVLVSVAGLCGVHVGQKNPALPLLLLSFLNGNELNKPGCCMVGCVSRFIPKIPLV